MVIRGILLIVGVLMLLGGLAAIAVGTGGQNASSQTLGGLYAVAIGSFLTIVAVLERTRYRSQSAEATKDAIGPGGGETTGPVDPRFRPTDEVFVDPTTGLKMRVLVDGRTGERRYVAEG
jgi:hypothetical protein